MYFIGRHAYETLGHNSIFGCRHYPRRPMRNRYRPGQEPVHTRRVPDRPWAPRPWKRTFTQLFSRKDVLGAWVWLAIPFSYVGSPRSSQ